MGVVMKRQVIELVIEQEKVSNLEWLGQQLRAKTMQFDESLGKSAGIPVNWEDRCGAIAKLPFPEHKALVSLLTWGDHRENTQDYNVLNNYFAQLLYVALEAKVQRKTFDLVEFCEKVAKMELFYYLRPFLVDLHTFKGKLIFAGITEVSPDQYSKKYMFLSEMVKIQIQNLLDEIEVSVGDYRRNTYKS